MSELKKLDERSREIFQKLVESYLSSGQPVGSRNLSMELSEKLSPATVRNVMSDLEALGLLGSQHISAGRMPTELGLRFFVDGILEMNGLSENDEARIHSTIHRNEYRHNSSTDIYERTGNMLSEIARSASLVFSKKHDARIKHIEFVPLSLNQALVVLVSEDGRVDNRLFTPPPGFTASDMNRASNFINAQIEGQTVADLRGVITKAIARQHVEIDELTAKLIEAGCISLIEESGHSQLVVRGRSHLIESQADEEEIEKVKILMDDLESKRDLVDLLDLVDNAQAVQVFIGSENKLFSLKSSSLVISPYMNGEGQIIGAIGVIGPTRLNYARIVPIVSYTAGLIGKMIEEKD